MKRNYRRGETLSIFLIP